MRIALILLVLSSAFAQQVDWVSQIRNKPVYDPRTYGATSNCVGDSGAGINSAISAASTAGGGVVKLAPGCYLVTSGLISMSSNVILSGSGRGSTTIRLGTNAWPASNTGPFYSAIIGIPVLVGSASGVTNVGIEKITFDGNGLNQANFTYGTTVGLMNSTYALIQELQFINVFHRGQMIGIHGTTGHDFRVFNNFLLGPGSAATGCATNIGPGGIFTQSPQGEISFNFVNGTCDEGLIANGTAAINVTFLNNTFVGYTTGTATVNAIHFEDASSGSAIGNKIFGPAAAGVNTAPAGSTTDVSNFIIQDNTISGITGNAGNGCGIGISPGATTGGHFTISGNSVLNGTVPGICAVNNVSGGIITGNTIRNNAASSGIQISATGTSITSHLTISNNTIDHNGTGGVTDSGIFIINSGANPPAGDISIIGNQSTDSGSPQVQEYGLFIQPFNGPPAHFIISLNNFRGNSIAATNFSTGTWLSNTLTNSILGPNIFEDSDAGNLVMLGAQIKNIPTTFATIGSCSSSLEGISRTVTDSTTATWGATITGTGANVVSAFCNGTNWTVAAK